MWRKNELLVIERIKRFQFFIDEIKFVNAKKNDENQLKNRV